MLTDEQANADRTASLPESAAAIGAIPGTWMPVRPAGMSERHPGLDAWRATDFTGASVRSPLARSLDRGLVLLGASGVVLAAVFLALVLPGTSIAWIYLLAVVIFWLFLAAGLLAWRRRPSNGMGTLIILGGFALYLGILADTRVPVLVAISEVCATLVLAVTFHLLHAFPSGRLRGGISRATVIAGYVVCVALQAPLYLFDPQNEVRAIVIADRADLVSVGIWLQRGAGLLVAAATVAVLASRIVHSRATHRRILIPLFGYGIFAVLFGPFGPLLLGSMPGTSPLTGVVMQLLVYAGVPIAFSLGVLRGGFARTSELQELGSWLGSTGTARPALTSAVARTLGDDSLRVLFWMEDPDIFVDADGDPAVPPPVDSGRAIVNIELDGRLVGAIEYDSVLIADVPLVQTAGRVVAIAVDRERLTVELLASQRELRRSRARLVEAAERERRRIARDLHDGLQVQLVLLAMKAGALAHAVGVPDPYRDGATALRLGIDSAAGELRELVHAVMPATLIEHGLSAATEDLVDRMPVPTRLELGVEDGSLPPMIESAAYFVLTEGLANALKHSRATECAVRLTRADGRLHIEVHDNGVGGAALERGTGLSGLGDRIHALGGELRIVSPARSGTRLLVELPCEL